MKPHRMRMTHNLLLNYGLYRKMEVYRPHKATQVPSLHLNRLLQCCGSRIRLFSIPDPKCLHPGSRILIKEFKYFNPKKTNKMVSKL